MCAQGFSALAPVQAMDVFWKSIPSISGHGKEYAMYMSLEQLRAMAEVMGTKKEDYGEDVYQDVVLFDSFFYHFVMCVLHVSAATRTNRARVDPSMVDFRMMVLVDWDDGFLCKKCKGDVFFEMDMKGRRVCGCWNRVLSQRIRGYYFIYQTSERFSGAMLDPDLSNSIVGVREVTPERYRDLFKLWCRGPPLVNFMKILLELLNTQVAPKRRRRPGRSGRRGRRDEGEEKEEEEDELEYELQQLQQRQMTEDDLRLVQPKVSRSMNAQFNGRVKAMMSCMGREECKAGFEASLASLHMGYATRSRMTATSLSMSAIRDYEKALLNRICRVVLQDKELMMEMETVIQCRSSLMSSRVISPENLRWFNGEFVQDVLAEANGDKFPQPGVMAAIRVAKKMYDKAIAGDISWIDRAKVLNPYTSSSSADEREEGEDQLIPPLAYDGPQVNANVSLLAGNLRDNIQDVNAGLYVPLLNIDYFMSLERAVEVRMRTVGPYPEHGGELKEVVETLRRRIRASGINRSVGVIPGCRTADLVKTLASLGRVEEVVCGIGEGLDDVDAKFSGIMRRRIRGSCFPLEIIVPDSMWDGSRSVLPRLAMKLSETCDPSNKSLGREFATSLAKLRDMSYKQLNMMAFGGCYMTSEMDFFNVLYKSASGVAGGINLWRFTSLLMAVAGRGNFLNTMNPVVVQVGLKSTAKSKVPDEIRYVTGIDWGSLSGTTHKALRTTEKFGSITYFDECTPFSPVWDPDSLKTVIVMDGGARVPVNPELSSSKEESSLKNSATNKVLMYEFVSLAKKDPYSHTSRGTVSDSNVNNPVEIYNFNDQPEMAAALLDRVLVISVDAVRRVEYDGRIFEVSEYVSFMDALRGGGATKEYDRAVMHNVFLFAPVLQLFMTAKNAIFSGQLQVLSCLDQRLRDLKIAPVFGLMTRRCGYPRMMMMAQNMVVNMCSLLTVWHGLSTGAVSWLFNQPSMPCLSPGDADMHLIKSVCVSPCMIVEEFIAGAYLTAPAVVSVMTSHFMVDVMMQRICFALLLMMGVPGYTKKVSVLKTSREYVEFQVHCSAETLLNKSPEMFALMDLARAVVDVLESAIGVGNAPIFVFVYLRLLAAEREVPNIGDFESSIVGLDARSMMRRVVPLKVDGKGHGTLFVGTLSYAFGMEGMLYLLQRMFRGCPREPCYTPCGMVEIGDQDPADYYLSLFHRELGKMERPPASGDFTLSPNFNREKRSQGRAAADAFDFGLSLREGQRFSVESQFDVLDKIMHTKPPMMEFVSQFRAALALPNSVDGADVLGEEDTNGMGALSDMVYRLVEIITLKKDVCSEREMQKDMDTFRRVRDLVCRHKVRVWIGVGDQRISDEEHRRLMEEEKEARRMRMAQQWTMPGEATRAATHRFLSEQARDNAELEAMGTSSSSSSSSSSSARRDTQTRIDQFYSREENVFTLSKFKKVVSYMLQSSLRETIERISERMASRAVSADSKNETPRGLSPDTMRRMSSLNVEHEDDSVLQDVVLYCCDTESRNGPPEERRTDNLSEVRGFFKLFCDYYLMLNRGLVLSDNEALKAVDGVLDRLYDFVEAFEHNQGTDYGLLQKVWSMSRNFFTTVADRLSTPVVARRNAHEEEILLDESSTDGTFQQSKMAIEGCSPDLLSRYAHDHIKRYKCYSGDTEWKAYVCASSPMFRAYFSDIMRRCRAARERLLMHPCTDTVGHLASLQEDLADFKKDFLLSLRDSEVDRFFTTPAESVHKIAYRFDTDAEIWNKMAHGTRPREYRARALEWSGRVRDFVYSWSTYFYALFHSGVITSQGSRVASFDGKNTVLMRAYMMVRNMTLHRFTKMEEEYDKFARELSLLIYGGYKFLCKMHKEKGLLIV